MSAPVSVVELVKRFGEQIEAYKSGKYNETQVRVEFIDPFFEALGWDIHNQQGLAPAYQDVVHEDAIKIGIETKAPDYCFRVGGTRKFFLEAKKPAVNIKDDIGPAFQVRRYAWSSKLPLSILTDFEEFAVYDCRIKPHNGDKPSVGRVFYCRFEDYIQKWDEIADIFSKDAVLKGSFDKFAESNKKKKGTTEVDDAFLEEIESWRETLAKNIALRNPKLSQRELNFSVQQTIDRIIFLRICEDRGIEQYGRLQGLLNGTNTYKRLTELFRDADDRYNSGLFHFKEEKERDAEPDTLTLSLTIDDDALKDILKNLYYPDSPYEFSVLPADILGQVYEQFLGKVIRLTEGHHAKIEEKPEVRKAGGVYYTPKYIVDYIVKNTVGKLIEGKNPKDVAKLRILDPACGSGSFLIQAYQYLLDWHRDWYSNKEPEKSAKGKNPAIYRGAGNEWRLTLTERKRILINNIYGVDIDNQAVEVTKLSLLLKVLEGQNPQSLTENLALLHERVLPDLQNNIKCGNSLIEPDFYVGQQIDLLDDEVRYQINVFNWRIEFPEVFNQGGFNAVIGNPPYIRMESFKKLKTYLKSHYQCHDERSDLYAYFIERGHMILHKGGRFGMIVSNKFLRANYGKPLRDFILGHSRLEQIVDFAGLPVFRGATVRTIILISSKEENMGKAVSYCPPVAPEQFAAIEASTLYIEDEASHLSYSIEPEYLAGKVWSFADQKVVKLLTKLEMKSLLLKQYCDGQICRGIVSGLTKAFVINTDTRSSLISANKSASEIIKPFLNGRDVRRYSIESSRDYLIYAYHGVDIRKYPAVEQHLRPFKQELEDRATKQEWYELQQPQMKFAPYFEGPKIIFPDISTTPRFALDEEGYYGSNTTYFIPRRDFYLLGLLNSKLGYFYFIITCAGLESKNEIYLRFFGQYLEGFPVKPLDNDDKECMETINKIESLSLEMHTLDKRLLGTKLAHDRALIEREITGVDKQLDQLVYRLYGLTAEEINIIEEATAG